MRLPTSKYDRWKTTEPDEEPSDEEIAELEEARAERLADAREEYYDDNDDAPYA